MAVGLVGALVGIQLASVSIEATFIGIPFSVGALVLAGTALSRSRDTGRDRELARLSMVVAVLPIVVAAGAAIVWAVTR